MQKHIKQSKTMQSMQKQIKHNHKQKCNNDNTTCLNNNAHLSQTLQNNLLKARAKMCGNDRQRKTSILKNIRCCAMLLKFV